MITDIMRTASQSIKVEEADYIEDGLLFCGRCHTPKQCRIVIRGETMTPMCLCKCQSEKKQAEEEEQREQDRIRRISELRRVGFPDVEMSRWTFDRDDGENEKISAIALRYVENFGEMKRRGKGLLLYGSVGTGKTFIASCIANALIEEGHPCLVTNFARLTNTIMGMYEGKQEFIDGLNKFDLLVIDDLASERDTEYMGEIVQSIIDARYRAGLPLIVTTNLGSDELRHPADLRKQRIYSRLFEMCVPVEVKGKDRRKEKLKSDFSELEEMLGL